MTPAPAPPRIATLHSHLSRQSPTPATPTPTTSSAAAARPPSEQMAAAKRELEGSAWSRPVRADAQWLPAAPGASEPGTPLSEEQLRSFTADGFLALPIRDLPPEFHAALHAEAAAIAADPTPPLHLDPACAGAGHRGMQEMESLQQVLHSPTMHGAAPSSGRTTCSTPAATCT
eukprot:COSAG04_NODE_4698_length_1942_cov_0.919154_2_plen_174_part_00